MLSLNAILQFNISSTSVGFYGHPSVVLTSGSETLTMASRSPYNLAFASFDQYTQGTTASNVNSASMNAVQGIIKIRDPLGNLIW
jgi:hypothetical protein